MTDKELLDVVNGVPFFEWFADRYGGDCWDSLCEDILRLEHTIPAWYAKLERRAMVQRKAAARQAIVELVSHYMACDHT